MAPIDATAPMGVAVLPAGSKPGCLGSQDGHTLIEVLVVLAIASIMAAMIIGGVRQLRGLKHLSERSAAQSVVDAVADHVADDVASALELPLLKSAPGEQVSLAGSLNEVRFNAVVRTGFRTRVLREVTLSIETPAGRRTLVRTSSARRLGQDERNRNEEKLVLHPNITGITFQYMMKDASGKAVWMNDWIGRPHLPVAVRFQVELSAEGVEVGASRTVGMPR